MATVAQIIAFADRYYPNSVSDANCIIDLDTIHKEIYNKIIRKKNVYELYTSYTVADQLTYTLPTDCLPENIIKIQISSDVTGSIDDNTLWQEYERATLEQDVDDGYYWHNMSDTTIIITKDGEPIDTSNYEIRFFYYKNPTAISTTTQTPDLDAEYHDLLYYRLINALSSQGQNPDVEIADYYQKKYEERMMQIENSLAERNSFAPIENEQLKMRW